MDDINYPTSGLYTFTVTLDDQNGGLSTYTQDAWIWRTDEVPVPVSTDGTLVSAISAATGLSKIRLTLAERLPLGRLLRRR